MSINIESRIRAANRVLAGYTPPPDPSNPITSSPSTPFLQFCFSEPGVYDHICPPFWFISWDSDEEGQPVFDYICNCGTSVNVHSSSCNGLTIAKIRMVKTKTNPLMENVWILCRWIPPPRRGDWLEFYGTTDNYPSNGRYVPVSSNSSSITFPADNPPFPETAEHIIKMFKEHAYRAPFLQEEAEIRQAKRDYTIPLRPDGGVDHGAGVLPGSQAEKYQHFFKDKLLFPGPKIYQPGLGANPVTKIGVSPNPAEPLIKIAKD